MDVQWVSLLFDGIAFAQQTPPFPIHPHDDLDRWSEEWKPPGVDATLSSKHRIPDQSLKPVEPSELLKKNKMKTYYYICEHLIMKTVYLPPPYLRAFLPAGNSQAPISI